MTTDSLQELQRQFVASLPSRLDALGLQKQEIRLDRWRADTVEQLHQPVHSLPGATAPSGFNRYQPLCGDWRAGCWQ